ncbi:MAG: hypothetical protein ACE5GA_10315 [Candidatus Zixiibacteriota bacterium]
MKKLANVLLPVIIALAFNSYAQAGTDVNPIRNGALTNSSVATSPDMTSRLGLGAMIGEPLGFSGKYWTGPTTAIDGGVAWSSKPTRISTCIWIIWFMISNH